ncbi:MAG: hypothetical protein FWD24_01170 [Treponema sp.]|nr:hypothetical protein [Treponema sp.]
MIDAFDDVIKKGQSLLKKCTVPTVKIYPSAELLIHLHVMREYLASQKGQYKDPDADDYIHLSWTGYCKEIGISYQKANYWLRSFTPNNENAKAKTRRGA